VILHFHITRPLDLEKLGDIREHYRRHGGRVVLFQSVTSAILISWEEAHLEWVPPYATRVSVGFKYMVWSVFLGWWSVAGLFCTPAAVLTNLFGGVDVTELAQGPPPIPEGGYPPPVRGALSVLKNREYYMLLLEFILLIVGILLYAVHAPLHSLRP
jgi:hypothetical protein